MFLVKMWGSFSLGSNLLRHTLFMNSNFSAPLKTAAIKKIIAEILPKSLNSSSRGLKKHRAFIIILKTGYTAVWGEKTLWKWN